MTFSVQLPGWPLCPKAVAWEAEDIAIAAGEFVHLLTPTDASLSRPANLPTPQWHNYTIRVNQFNPSEWPQLTPATTTDLSIGEEQSDSTVIALSWSHAGLGRYTRSVLSVLTSNLILSLWETNGSPGVWQRTCVVNNLLKPALATLDAHSRRTARIRSFAWLPKATQIEQTKSGTHLMILADDALNLHVCRIRKTHNIGYGNWAIDAIAAHALAPPLPVEPRSFLRQVLETSSPVSDIETTDWTFEPLQDHLPATAELQVKVSFGQVKCAQYFSVRVSRVGPSVTDSSDPSEIAVDITHLDKLQNGCQLLQPPQLSRFDEAMMGPKSDFDERWKLGGQIRVRSWGAAYSHDRTQAAACVTFHPSRMLESTAAAHQRAWIFVASLGPQRDKPPVESRINVIDRILSFLAGISPAMIKTELDRKVARNAISLIRMYSQELTSFEPWAATISSIITGTAADQTNAEAGQLPTNGHQTFATNPAVHLTSLTEELCEVCNSSIPFEASARCSKGHVFTRCSLSFLAIQEPGISMSCAQCGKQFLDPGKLELADGLCFSRLLFSEFDVCPYCQGKYRG